MIPQRTIEEIQLANDVVDVVSSYLPLKKAGRNFKALCPFHNEKTPSFMVSPEKQLWHCFGCGAGGSVIGFVMQYEHLSFPEAVRFLGERAGIEVPEQRGDPIAKGAIKKEDLFRVNEFACAWFRQQLSKGAAGAPACNYLASRGIADSTVREFSLGYAPDSWDALLTAARAKGLDQRALLSLGLVMKKEGSGRTFDRFRNRLIFPLRDITGRVIGFSGRVMGEGMPKYMNSPDSPLFHKSRSLYGLYYAKRAIADSGTAFVVEGHFDFLMLYQEGIRNVVASQGTAFTAEHARILKRYTDEIVMSLDSDSAGTAAAEAHGLEAMISLLETGFRVKVMMLPHGEDPDSLVRSRGSEAFLSLAREAPNYFDFLIEAVCSRHPLETESGKSTAASEFLSSLARVPDAIFREAYLRKFSERIGISMQALLSELNKKSRLRGPSPSPRVDLSARSPALPAGERELVKLMIEKNEVLKLVAAELTADDFRHAHLRKIAAAAFSLVDKGETVDSTRLISRVPGEECAAVLSGLMADDVPTGDSLQIARDCIVHIRKKNLREELKRIGERISEKERAGAPGSDIAALQQRLLAVKSSLLTL